MTHGDKKAKPGKTSQASAKKSSKAVPPGKERGKAVSANGAKGKSPVKAGTASAKAGSGKGTAPKAVAKAVAKTGSPATVAKGSTGKGSAPAAPAKDAAARRVASAKTDIAAADPFGFSDPGIAAAFKRAVKKYPNAFRRLTD